MKHSWKGHKDRNRHKNRIKRSGQAQLVYVEDINCKIPTTWSRTRGELKRVDCYSRIPCRGTWTRGDFKTGGLLQSYTLSLWNLKPAAGALHTNDPSLSPVSLLSSVIAATVTLFHSFICQLYCQVEQAEFSTDYTGSALWQRYCDRVFRGFKMTVACLHLFAALSSPSI